MPLNNQTILSAEEALLSEFKNAVRTNNHQRIKDLAKNFPTQYPDQNVIEYAAHYCEPSAAIMATLVTTQPYYPVFNIAVNKFNDPALIKRCFENSVKEYTVHENVRAQNDIVDGFISAVEFSKYDIINSVLGADDRYGVHGNAKLTIHHLLLESAKDNPEEFQKLLKDAADNGYTNMMTLLIDELEVKPDYQLLEVAVNNKNTALVDTLCKKDIKVTHDQLLPMLSQAVTADSVAILDKLYNKYQSLCPLTEVLANTWDGTKRNKCIQFMLNNGAVPRQEHLIGALVAGNEDVYAEILRRNSQAVLSSEAVHQRINRMTKITLSPNFVRLLIKDAKCSPNMKIAPAEVVGAESKIRYKFYVPFTLLEACIRTQEVGIIEFLLKRGVVVHKTEYDLSEAILATKEAYLPVNHCLRLKYSALCMKESDYRNAWFAATKAKNYAPTDSIAKLLYHDAEAFLGYSGRLDGRLNKALDYIQTTSSPWWNFFATAPVFLFRAVEKVTVGSVAWVAGSMMSVDAKSLDIEKFAIQNDPDLDLSLVEGAIAPSAQQGASPGTKVYNHRYVLVVNQSLQGTRTNNAPDICN